MKNKEDLGPHNAKVLANAVQLATNVLFEVAGNDIAASVGGESLESMLADTMTAKINSKLSVKGGA